MGEPSRELVEALKATERALDSRDAAYSKWRRLDAASSRLVDAQCESQGEYVSAIEIARAELAAEQKGAE